ncbi:MAG: hypothetical protein ACYDDF_15215 [Thermoplasmatota archaeon]
MLDFASEMVLTLVAVGTSVAEWRLSAHVSRIWRYGITAAGVLGVGLLLMRAPTWSDALVVAVAYAAVAAAVVIGALWTLPRRQREREARNTAIWGLIMGSGISGASVLVGTLLAH